MKPSEIRALSVDEIANRVEDAREAYFKLRFKAASGQLTDTAALRRARQEIARLETILKEKQRAAAAEGRQA
ncbi:MAG: 50S ribosomal protein L29 [Chloroflexota bacterium]